MVPTAVSQVSEQLIRVVTILLSVILVYHDYSLYRRCGAVFGSVTGIDFSPYFLIFMAT